MLTPDAPAPAEESFACEPPAGDGVALRHSSGQERAAGRVDAIGTRANLGMSQAGARSSRASDQAEGQATKQRVHMSAELVTAGKIR
jgi:hypothetical protein